MAPGRPNRALCVPLQTKTRPRPLTDTARNGSCLPDACFALHTIAPAAHDANKASNTKNGRGDNSGNQNTGHLRGSICENIAVRMTEGPRRQEKNGTSVSRKQAPLTTPRIARPSRTEAHPLARQTATSSSRMWTATPLRSAGRSTNSTGRTGRARPPRRPRQPRARLVRGAKHIRTNLPHLIERSGPRRLATQILSKPAVIAHQRRKLR